jgi:hypothetical protein
MRMKWISLLTIGALLVGGASMAGLIYYHDGVPVHSYNDIGGSSTPCGWLVFWFDTTRISMA